MNRRSFIRNLVLGLVAAPMLLKKARANPLADFKIPVLDIPRPLGPVIVWGGPNSYKRVARNGKPVNASWRQAGERINSRPSVP